jgi:hypothetical protein
MTDLVTSDCHISSFGLLSGKTNNNNNKLISLYTYYRYDHTVKVTYTAQGFPDTIMTFDLTDIDIESIKEELPLKKKELDSKFNVDPQKSTIRIDDDTSIRET